MWEKCGNIALSGRFLRCARNCGLLVVFAGSLMFCAQARADAVSNAVLNYTGSYWAAFYDGDLTTFNPSGSASLILNNINPADGIEIEDPSGNHYLDSSLNLQINLLSGAPTGGQLQETLGDLYYSADFSQTSNPTPATLYSSTIIRGFGQIPNTTGVNYWFAFQNGSNPNNLIGGFIDSADVKTFAVSIPEPSSVAVLALVGIVCGMGRISRRFQRTAV
jgi:hypothetical protein